ncbi:MAG: hypothetical protein EPN86_06295 [Nanoarchaeota archaeon]|nr:MAG: hypothetical protein EPN86_06295 [Nanoarchaeota archaeon]
MINKVRTQQSIFGQPIYGLVGEINDPSKMSKASIAADVMDPSKRIQIWRSYGMKKVFHEYIQITTDPKVYTNDCSLFVYPIHVAWRNGMPKQDLIDVLYWLQVYSNEYSPEALKRYGPYQRMMRSIASKPPIIPYS